MQEYQQWYEKILACRDTILDLKDQEADLYKQRFDNTQSFWESQITYIQTDYDLMEAYLNQLKEGGKLSAKNLLRKQSRDLYYKDANGNETGKVIKLQEELKNLQKRRDEALNSGKIKQNSDEWRTMQDAISEVKQSIVETKTEIITINNAIRQVDWDRWDKIHDAISGVNNELEFLKDLIREDDMFEKNGTITSKGIAAYGILATEYDAYYKQAQEYAKELKQTQKEWESDKYNQDLIDKIKDLTEAEQNAITNANRMKDAMVDVAEKGVKKQIDYVKELIDKYTDLLDAEKDQRDYARKVADQQKEINKLEKQYRAMANDTSEEGKTKRQRLKDQLDTAKKNLKDTQEDRRISETKEMLSDFQENFEKFLNEKLENVEQVVKDGIDLSNKNSAKVRNTIKEVAGAEGYKINGSLESILNASTERNSVLNSYFNKDFTDTTHNISSIAKGVDKIIEFYSGAQGDSERQGRADLIDSGGSHIMGGTYYYSNGNASTRTGTQTTGGKTYYLEKGKITTPKAGWKTNEKGLKYYFNGKSQTAVTGFQTIGGKKYYFNNLGIMQTGLQTINGDKYYFNKDGSIVKGGWRKVGNSLYYFEANTGKAHGGWLKKSGKYFFFDPTTKAQVVSSWIQNNKVTKTPKKGARYIDAKGIMVANGKKKTNLGWKQFDKNGAWKGYKSGTSKVPYDDLYWTNEEGKSEAIIRKSDGAILTPLSKGDSVIPNGAMKNMYQALVDPEKYLKQFTSPNVKIIQNNADNQNRSPANVNIQFIANGVQDANKFANDLMNNKKLEKWVQEVTLGQANGNNSYRKFAYTMR